MYKKAFIGSIIIFSITIPENTGAGQSVSTVTAVDHDDTDGPGQYGLVRYSIIGKLFIRLEGKKEPVALLSLSSLCHVIAVWLFLAVPLVCLQFVIVVFPDQTHLLFSTRPKTVLLLWIIYVIYVIYLA